MSEIKYNHSTNGQEVLQVDLNLLAASALADDRLLADLIRMKAYDGSTVLKAIMPFDFYGVTGEGTVKSSGSANGSIHVNPFRAIIGARTVLATSTRDNWRDIRSWVWTNASTTLHQVVSIAANSSGNPRWDLIVARVDVDIDANSVTRKVKDPSSGAISTPSVYTQKVQTVTIQVVAGTPGASPALPAITADGSGAYYIPLAYVKVNNGHTSGTTILAKEIYDAAPVVPISRATGAVSLCPANLNYKPNGTTITSARIATWGAAGANNRPAYLLPATMVGGASRFILLDASSASSADWSHAHEGIVDDTIDWRMRYFRYQIFADSGSPAFASEVGAAAGTQTPNANTNERGVNYLDGMGQSFLADLAAGKAAVVWATSTTLTQILNASGVGIYVDTATGALKAHISTDPRVKCFIWIDATAPFVNHS